MNIFKLNKISLAALLLASMALVMLPGCSSTEESSGTGGTYDECVAGCAAGDVDCREVCARTYTP